MPRDGLCAPGWGEGDRCAHARGTPEVGSPDRRRLDRTTASGVCAVCGCSFALASSKVRSPLNSLHLRCMRWQLLRSYCEPPRERGMSSSTSPRIGCGIHPAQSAVGHTFPCSPGRVVRDLSTARPQRAQACSSAFTRFTSTRRRWRLALGGAVVRLKYVAILEPRFGRHSGDRFRALAGNETALDSGLTAGLVQQGEIKLSTSGNKTSVWWRDTFVGVLIIALAAGVITFFIQVGVLEPIFKPQSQPQAETAPVVSQASEPESQPASQPVATPSPVYESAAPVEPSPEPSPTPPPLDDKTITEARIEMSSTQDNIAPGVVRVRANPAFYTVVVTAAGVLDSRDECYVHWTVQNNGETLHTSDSRCAKLQGYGASFWPRVRYEPGSVRVLADIIIDGGESRSIEFNYEVQ